MRPDDFLLLLRKQPFEPFRLYLSTGETYDIRHPEMAVVERSIVWIHVPATGVLVPLLERRLFVVLLHIVRGEFLGSAVSPSKNGGGAQ